MSGVDLSRYRFDYDLTFCCLLMNADGTIYHVYGGRDATGPQSHLSMASLCATLQRTLDEHAAYQAAPKPPKLGKKRVVEDSPAMQKRKKQECVHCHTVHDVQYEDVVAARRWKRSDIWIYPDPIEVGLVFDRDEQTTVAAVEAGSAADEAGLQAGDRIATLDGRTVATFGDVQTVLHETTDKSVRLPVTFTRDDETRRATLGLSKGWKEATPEVFAWRPSKWPLPPKPGFGGRALSADEKSALALPDAVFAFRVGYLVTWGDDAHTGRNAQQAGIRKGDVVIRVAGKSDFRSEEHFQAWFRLTQKPGSTCDVELLRGRERVTVRLPVVE